MQLRCRGCARDILTSKLLFKFLPWNCDCSRRCILNKNKMGSTDKAVITGFICRLCSKMNRFVIHIYGEEGERMKLAEKINNYLPITVSTWFSLFYYFLTFTRFQNCCLIYLGAMPIESVLLLLLCYMQLETLSLHYFS